MAKKHHRFGKLHQTLKDSNYSATSGAAGEYFNYLKGVNKLVVARKPDSKYLKRFNVGIVPFDIEPSSDPTAINAYQAAMTVQADNIRTAFNSLAADTLYGIQRDLTKTKEIAGFYAATARITVIATNSTKTAKTSGITKKAYKTYNSRTGSVPYGRTLTQVKDPNGAAVTDISKVTEEDCRTAIMEAIDGKTAASYTCTGVCFTPEIHPAAGFFGHAKDANAATDIPAS